MTDLSPEQIRSLGSQALLITFVITAALGAIMQRTNFCTLGAVSDGILMEDWSRMRQWALVMATAMAGSTAATVTGAVGTSSPCPTGL